MMAFADGCISIRVGENFHTGADKFPHGWKKISTRMKIFADTSGDFRRHGRG
jgi:hypothetical protein